MSNSVTSKVPQLRFPEFSGGWGTHLLKALSKSGFSNGVFNDKNKVGSGYKLINVKDMYEGDSINTDSLTLLELDESEFKRNQVSFGDIFFTRSSIVAAGIAYSNINLSRDSDITFDGHLMRMSPDTNKVDPEFLAINLRSQKPRRQFIARAKVSTMATIGQDDIASVKIRAPLLVEQKKIATFISAIDKKISLLRQKHEQLVQYKKGIIQQLFSQQLRFKDDNGQDFPDWHLRKLGVLTKKSGKKNKEGISYPVYSINNKEGFLPQSDQFDGMDSEERGFDISMYKIVDKNTFAYNPARINVGSIGFSADLENVIISSLYVCFKTTKELSDRYLLAYLDTFDFNKSVLRNAEGGVRQYLFYENLCNIRIPLPSVGEQNKIADFIESIDKKIKLAQQQIEQTQTYKQGLLQQMFV